MTATTASLVSPLHERATMRRSSAAHHPASDPVMDTVLARGTKLVARGVPVLLLGETGTGKEFLTRALHAASARRDAPLVAVNCAAIPDTLIESELFGYVKGAFSGALACGMKGKVADADGGILFLDEIGDMPMAQQTRLLRVLAEREVTPLGASRPVPVDFLLICATTQDLAAKVADGSFREDLYYRIAGGVLRLPPLRERADLVALIHKLVQAELPERDAAQVVTPAVMDVLLQQQWPGNVRQLSATLRYACAVMDGEFLVLDDLPDDLPRPTHVSRPSHMDRGMARRPVSGVPAGGGADNVYVLGMGARGHADVLPMTDPERERVIRALDAHRWNMAASARALGICRASLYRVLRRLDIPLIREQASASTRLRQL